MNSYYIQVWRTLYWWVITTFLIFLAGFVLILAWLVIGSTLDINGILNHPPVFGIVNGAIWGWVIGSLQRHVLRKYFFWAATHWQCASIIGGIVGAFLNGMVPAFYYSTGSIVVLLACISIAQWFTLRHSVRMAWLWVLGCTVAALLFVRFSLYEGTYFEPYRWYHLVIGMASLTTIPGIMMLHLFIYHPRPMVPEGSPQASIWDEAI